MPAIPLDAIYKDTPRVRFRKAGEYVNKGGFPASITADYRDFFTRTYVKTNTVQAADIPKLFRHALGRYCWDNWII
jgi:hypothetical protein